MDATLHERDKKEEILNNYDELGDIQTHATHDHDKEDDNDDENNHKSEDMKDPNTDTCLNHLRKRCHVPVILSLDLLPYRSPHLTLSQLQLVTTQLGYIPYNLVEVASSTHSVDDGGSGGGERALVGILYGLSRSTRVGERYE